MAVDRDGDQIYLVAGEAIAADEAVTMDTGDGLAYKANANSGAESLPCLGFAETAAAIGEGFYVRKRGIVSPAPNSLLDGVAYLANTAGDISNTAGDTSQIVGYVVPKRGAPTVYELHIDCQLVADNHAAQS